MASRGIIKSKITKDPPIKLPTKISGLLSKIELIPTDISVVEVKIPKIKKETKKDETLMVLEKLSVPCVIKLDAIHINKPASPKRKRLSSII